MKKINNPRLRMVCFGLLMSICMALSMSTIMLWINFGLFPGFLKALGIVLVTRSIPAAILMFTLLTKIFKKVKGLKGRAISGATIGFVMSFLVTTSRIGIHHPDFLFIWMRSFAIGFCIASVLAITFAFLVKRVINYFFEAVDLDPSKTS